MPSVLRDFSASALVHANETNQEDVYRLIAGVPGVEILEDAEILRIYTGVPHFAVNGVLRTRLSGAHVAARIAATVDYFRCRNVPMMWAVGPSTEPADLATHLVAHGLTLLDDLPGLAADLDSLPQSMRLPANAAVEEVMDSRMLEDWSHAISIGFGMPRAVVDVFGAATRALGYGEGVVLRNFVAYLDGEPVGNSTLFLGAGVAGVYSVSVVPGARRQGIGAAITAAPLRAARKLGYRIGTLLASAMGDPVYRKLGFTEHGRFALYGYRETPPGGSS